MTDCVAEISMICIAGFQLVDGKERIIVVEGLAEGAMQRMEGIALQALTGALPQPSGICRRAVHWHKGLRSICTSCVIPFRPLCNIGLAGHVLLPLLA